MAQTRMPWAFFDLVARHLPLEQPTGLGDGWPPASQRVVLNILWLVLSAAAHQPGSGNYLANVTDNLATSQPATAATRYP